jgi:hypothetical protein
MTKPAREATIPNKQPFDGCFLKIMGAIGLGIFIVGALVYFFARHST